MPITGFKPFLISRVYVFPLSILAFCQVLLKEYDDDDDDDDQKRVDAFLPSSSC